MAAVNIISYGFIDNLILIQYQFHLIYIFLLYLSIFSLYIFYIENLILYNFQILNRPLNRRYWRVWKQAKQPPGWTRRVEREEHCRSLRKGADYETNKELRMVPVLLKLLSLRCGFHTHSHQSPRTRVLCAVHQVKREEYCCQEGNEQGIRIRRFGHTLHELTG